MSRRYFDISRTPKQSLNAIRSLDGLYHTLGGVLVGIDRACEHCDSERSHKVRLDHLRGFVCPPCDSALDEMLDEAAS